MRAVGIDIGSRFIKMVVLEGGEMVEHRRLDTGYQPKQTCDALLEEARPDKTTITGYGRQLFDGDDKVSIITEIRAVAAGAHQVLPECRTVIDIGGQDTKIISVTSKGRVSDFEMNDRCAAGTGRFLEVMARNLGFTLDELGALEGDNSVAVNSQCTVFAESEVISLIAKGIEREQIGLAVQKLIASNVSSMAKRQNLKDTIVFTGGCAFNKCMQRLIQEDIGFELKVSPQSHILAAYGAALLAE